MLIYREAGSWCDVIAAGGKFAFVYSKGAVLACELAGQVKWTVTLPQVWLYTRAAASPAGSIIAVGQGADDFAYYVLDGQPAKRLGPSRGQNVVVARWSEKAICFEVSVQSGPASFDIYKPTKGTREQSRMEPTSQGFRDWNPEQPLPTRGDDAFVQTVNGWQFVQPNTRAGVTVGQIDGTDDIRVAVNGRVFLGIPGRAYEPHVAVIGTTIAVCARTPRGAALATFAAPYPADERPPVHNPPPPPPDPDPDPEPEPEVTMRLPVDVKALRAQFIQKFPIPQQRDGEELSDFEERVRQWSIDLAEQCAFTFDGQGYGMKRASNGRPISKDTLARMYMGKLLIWDNLIGTGTGKPKLANDPDSQDASDQVFVRVTPTNHLGETKPPDPPPPPPPPPPAQGYDDTALRKRISDLEAKFAEQSMALGNAQAALGVLQLKLANLRVKGGTSKVWGHAHDVDLKVEG